MKKVVFVFAAILMMAMTSCKGGYDQKKVDELMKLENPTEADFEAIIEQCNYALDDAESAKDFEKWAEENQEEANSMMQMYLGLAFSQLDGTGFPESLKDDVAKLMKRFEKFGGNGGDVNLDMNQDFSAYDSELDGDYNSDEVVAVEEIGAAEFEADTIDGGLAY